MTPIELGLTAAVVVLAFVSVTALVMHCRKGDLPELFLGMEGLRKRIVVLEAGSKEIERVARTADEINARLAIYKPAKQALAEMREELTSLRDQVAGMQVSREVLGEPEFSPRIPAPRVAGRGVMEVRPEAWPDAAHPEPRFRTEGEPDPETAESEAVECDQDAKTEVMQEPVFVSVDERSEA